MEITQEIAVLTSYESDEARRPGLGGVRRLPGLKRRCSNAVTSVTAEGREASERSSRIRHRRTRRSKTLVTWKCSHGDSHIHVLEPYIFQWPGVDYTPEVTKGPGAAHCTFEHRYFKDIPVPSARRVLVRDAKGRADQNFSLIPVGVHSFAIKP
jgi:hypothetical protein